MSKQNNPLEEESGKQQEEIPEYSSDITSERVHIMMEDLSEGFDSLVSEDYDSLEPVPAKEYLEAQLEKELDKAEEKIAVAEKKESRCIGHCCEDFSVEISPEEMAGSYQRWLGHSHYPNASTKSIDSSADSSGGTYNGENYKGGCAPIYPDIHLIYPMLEFIKKDNSHPDTPEAHMPRTVYHYRCKHFDKEKKMCGIYEIRPQVCRAYGLSGCGYKKCTWKKATDIRKKEEDHRGSLGKKDNIAKWPEPRKAIDPMLDCEPKPKIENPSVVGTKRVCPTCKIPAVTEDCPPKGWRWVCKATSHPDEPKCTWRSEIFPYPMPF